jgi:hypothetical protein
MHKCSLHDLRLELPQPHACYMSHPSYFAWFGHHNNTRESTIHDAVSSTPRRTCYFRFPISSIIYDLTVYCHFKSSTFSLLILFSLKRDVFVICTSKLGILQPDTTAIMKLLLVWMVAILRFIIVSEVTDSYFVPALNCSSFFSIRKRLSWLQFSPFLCLWYGF